MLKIFRWMESKRRTMQSRKLRDAKMKCVDREHWRGLVNDMNVHHMDQRILDEEQ